MVSARLTLTTIWYSVDVSVHDTNSGVAITPPACRAAAGTRSSANSQVAANIHRPGFNLTQEDIISPVSRSEVWRNDWIVVISRLRHQPGPWFHNRGMCV